MPFFHTDTFRESNSTRVAFPVLLLLCALASCPGCGSRPSQAPAEEALSLVTPDGTRIAATLFPVPQESPPGVVLVHALGSNKESWQPLVGVLQEAGIMSIAIDLRGHGQSGGPEGTAIPYTAFDKSEWMKCMQEIRLAMDELEARGADPARLGLVGASIGANLAAHVAASDLRTEALILISPGLVYKGVECKDALKAYGERPVMLITSRGDTYSDSSCKTLREVAGGFAELRKYAGAGHGTRILEESRNARMQLIDWLQTVFGMRSDRQKAAS